jgi:hypothetical protein
MPLAFAEHASRVKPEHAVRVWELGQNDAARFEIRKRQLAKRLCFMPPGKCICRPLGIRFGRRATGALSPLIGQSAAVAPISSRVPARAAACAEIPGKVFLTSPNPQHAFAPVCGSLALRAA